MDSHYYANTHDSYTKAGWVFGEMYGGIVLMVGRYLLHRLPS
jgi:hypothetical protein